MEPNDQPKSGFERFNEWRRNSHTLKLITIGFVLLLLLLPLELVRDLIRERHGRKQDAVDEISRTWGSPQVINGPILTIPFYTTVLAKDPDRPEVNVPTRMLRYAHFLPEKLNVNSVVTPELRKRGIYDILVYSSNINLEGTFVQPTFADWQGVEEVLWNAAFVSVGIPDMKAISQMINLQWNGQAQAMSPGVENAEVFTSGVSSFVPINPDYSAEIPFKFDLSLRGNTSLEFVPLGKETDVKMSSTWSSPKAIGAFLPSAPLQASNNGFETSWKVLHLNRNFPQKFIDVPYEIDQSAFGVELMIMVDEYDKNERSAKYAVLLIALTFLVFFFMQVLNKIQIHFVQYIMAGLALCLFYVLLLSFSEQLGFNTAYFISMGATIALIGLYFKAATQSWKLSGLLSFVLLFVYVFVFVIIQLEDMALMVGSIGLFISLASVMYLSRNVNWYALGEPKSAK
jgi:inner membrane protein